MGRKEGPLAEFIGQSRYKVAISGTILTIYWNGVGPFETPRLIMCGLAKGG
jgi:hypothetical protein